MTGKLLVAGLLATLLWQGCVAEQDEVERAVDLIVAGAFVVTMDPRNPLIEDGAIAIDDGAIVAVSSREDIAAAYRASETLGGENRVLMPGLVNGHTHAAMTLLRGIADDRALMDWLLNYIFPAEVQFVDEDFVRIGTELACWEMLRGGTTTFVDMYYFPETVAQAVDACGIRALVGATVIDQKSPDAADGEEGLANARAFVERWSGASPRVLPAFAPHGAYTVPPALLEAVRDAADELGAPVTIHVAETRGEMDIVAEKYRTTPVAHLDALGFFAGPTIAAHMVWPRDGEIPLLAERGVGVIHNPTSNMKIASGVSPVPALLEAGVAVGLGTDGAASNNDLDMWEEMRLAAFLQKIHTMDPRVLPAATVLRMATLGGAEALGLGDRIGAITVGRRADVIQVSLRDAHFVPVYDLVSHLVYVADEQDVDTVVVEGRVVVRDGRVLTIDAARIRREAGALAARIRGAVVDSAR